MMKNAILLLLVCIFSVSCQNTWTQEGKDAFHEACMENAVRWAETQEVAKTYCDCVFAKMEKKYPHESDAIEHIAELAKDSSLLNCKEEILGKRSDSL